jgi:GT2 family glycosyltransferase
VRFASSADVAIVIPVHNGIDLTLKCLQSLRRGDAEAAMVIVVDDGSLDGTSAALRREHPDVHVLREDGSLWWSRAVNVGCRFASGRSARTVILLNNDNVEVSPNFVSELGARVEQTGGCVAAAVLFDASDGSRCVLQLGGTLDWGGRGVSMPGYGDDFAPRDELTARDWLPGCALAFSVELFDNLEGIDPRFPQYRGDIDFTLRARQKGYPLHVCHACWVVNDRSQAGLDLSRRTRLVDFLHGFVSLKSNYNLRESVPFAFRHCPPSHRVQYLTLFYLRNTYAFLKTRRRRPSSALTSFASHIK